MAPSTTSTANDGAPITDATATTSSNRKRDIFPFLELPAELRNRVYRVAFYHDRASGRLAVVALLRVCQQIHSEAKEIIFEESAFYVQIKTPETWVPDLLKLQELVSSGDLELRLQGQKSGLGHYLHPPMGCIYDLLPKVARKLVRINIELEATSSVTTCNFLYALACFLNTTGSKTEELHIKVVGGATANYNIDIAEHMWYPLMKMPDRLSIFMSGVLGRKEWGDHWPVVTHVHRRLLKDNRPHPLRPANSTFNLITETRRVIAFARPIVDATLESHGLLQGSADGHAGKCDTRRYNNVHWKLEELEILVEHKRPTSRFMCAYNDEGWRVDLLFCEEWATKIRSAECFGLEEEDAWWKRYHKEYKEVQGEADRWDLSVKQDPPWFSGDALSIHRDWTR